MGKERVEEISDPEIAMQRVVSTYRRKGYSEEWIGQRMRSIETITGRKVVSKKNSKTPKSLDE